MDEDVTTEQEATSSDEQQQETVDQVESEAEDEEAIQQDLQIESIKAFFDEKVVINRRYTVYAGKPLSQFDLPSVKAYFAEDKKSDKSLFAYVCRPDLPIRTDQIRLRKGLKVKGLMCLVDAGVGYWKEFDQKTYFLIYEAPAGGRIWTGEKKKYVTDESILIENWIKPVMVALSNMLDRGLTHRAVRPDNMFYADAERTEIILGDCIATPPAYDQPDMLETIPSLLCQKYGRGNGTVLDDLYAFGGTLLCMSIGYNPVEQLSKDELIDLKLQKGSYASLIGTEKVNLSMIELLRGLLNDDANQRWSITAVQQWIDGRRLTPMQFKSQTTSQRPFNFDGDEYFNYQTLAVAFMRKWNLAAEVIRSEKFETWLLRGFEDKVALLTLKNIKEIASMSFSVKEKQDDYVISRTIMYLYPAAPLVLKSLSFMPDGFGMLLAYYVLNGENLSTLSMLVNKGYMESWFLVRDDRVAAQQLKSYQISLSKPDMGAGIEHLLYELNENFPCQSPLVKKEYVVTVQELLPALEATSRTIDIKTDPIDRHIAAFLNVNYGAKLATMLKDINSNHDNVVADGILHIYSTLQYTMGPEKLVGLTGWVGKHAMPMIKNYHNLETRQDFEKAYPKLLKKGNMPEIYKLLNDKEELLLDRQNFVMAQKEYKEYADEIDFLEGNRTMRSEEILQTGFEVAALLSMGVALLVVIILLIGVFFGW